MNTDYIPSTDAALSIWSVNFDTKLATYATQLGLAAADVTAANGHTAAIRTAINNVVAAKAAANMAVATKTAAEKANLAPLRAFIQQIKKNSAYTADIGEDLGINSSVSSVDESTYQSILTATTYPGHVTLKFTKNGVEGVNIYARLKGATAWQKLSYDSHSPYVDNRALAVADQPENREYMCIGVLGDAEIGQQSDIVSVAFAG